MNQQPIPLNAIPALYFDGQTSHAYPSYVWVTNQLLKIQSIDQDLTLSVSISDLKTLGRGFSSGQKVAIGKMGMLEIASTQAWYRCLGSTKQPLKLVEQLQQSMLASIISLLTVFAIFGMAHRFLLPEIAAAIAPKIPNQWWIKVEDEVLKSEGTDFFKPSKLNPEEQKKITEQFAALVNTVPHPPKYSLMFRSLKIGPNALALPSGRIILGDELIALSPTNEATYGVLFHELGHINHSHGGRGLIETSTFTALLTFWLGDVSAMATLVASSLASAKFTRDHETEADDYAIAMMKIAKLSTEPLALLFEKLQQTQKNRVQEIEFLQSHPLTADRIARFRAAEQQKQNKSN